MISAFYKLCRCPICGVIWAICPDPLVSDCWYYHDAAFIIRADDSNARVSGYIQGDDDFFCVNEGETLEFLYDAIQVKDGQWIRTSVPNMISAILS